MADKKPPKVLPGNFDFDNAPDTLPANFDFAAKAPNAGLSAPGYAPIEMQSDGWMGKLGIKAGLAAANAPAGLAMSIPPVAATYGTYKHLQEANDPVLDKAARGLMVDPKAVAEAARNNDWGQLAAETVVPIAATLLGGRMFRGKEVPAGEIVDRPPVAPDVPQVTAGKVRRAVNPSPEEATRFQDNVQQELGNITEHANQNGLPLDTRKGFVSAARAAAESRKAYYKNEILKPYELDTVKAPSNFNGDFRGDPIDGQTTIGSLEARLSKVNAELRQPFQAGQQGKVIQGLASKGDLNAEAAAIRSALYGELSKRTGIPASEIGRLKESYGRMYDIADKTDMAVNREIYGEESYDRSGSTGLPTSKVGMVKSAWNKVQGGAEKIGDRKFSTALLRSSIDSVGLPKPNPPAASPFPQRTPVWDGLNTEGAPLGVETTGPAAAADFQAQTQQKGMNRGYLRDMLKASEAEKAARTRERLRARQDISKNQR